jgi:hypothetical protein
VGALTASEVSLGLVALSTSPEVNADFIDGLIRQIDDGAAPTDVEEGALRRAAAQFQLRGAAGALQPALVGLWAGTCTAFGEVGTVPVGVAQALSGLYGGCRGQRRPAKPKPITRGDVLLIEAMDDVVVPPTLQSRWKRVFPHAAVRCISAAGHSREDGRTAHVIADWLAAR